ncbi:hypothetical protein [Saccharicrinis fermentans]|uniref:hypothetical protein n=1 Tax=Saccharicrinis fermentans TaxID=982 RepID=UPI00048698C0|nr:hypothetical protein [Saccharicrinis fermentans]
MKYILILLLGIGTLEACENPYEEVSKSKTYAGDPFVSLSSEQATIKLGVSESSNHTMEAGVFKDSLVLSHVLEDDLYVELEMVEDESLGDLDTHFTFQEIVYIAAGTNYGYFDVSGLDIPEDDISKYKLALRIKEVNIEGVIAGLYGIKKENEERQKRFKAYSFQN